MESKEVQEIEKRAVSM